MEFEKKWSFPHCIGAMDGKHITTKCPINAGSTYFNYKHFNRNVFMGIIDADFKFIYVDVSCNGRVNCAGIFARSEI